MNSTAIWYRLKQERIKMVTRVRTCNCVKSKQGEFPASTYHALRRLRKTLMLLNVHVTSFLFLGLAGNSALTMDLYWSYTLLL